MNRRDFIRAGLSGIAAAIFGAPKMLEGARRFGDSVWPAYYIGWDSGDGVVVERTDGGVIKIANHTIESKTITVYAVGDVRLGPIKRSTIQTSEGVWVVSP